MTWGPRTKSSPGTCGSTSVPRSSTIRTSVWKYALPVEPARVMASSGAIRQIRRGTGREDSPHGRAVAVHHALRQTRGAGGVHEVQEVVVLGQDLRLPCGRGAVEIRIAHRERGPISRFPHIDPGTYRCALTP